MSAGWGAAAVVVAACVTRCRRGVAYNALDPPAVSWVAKSPKWMQPYLRLSRADRPIGTWLLMWPCTWSLTLAAAADGLPEALPALVSNVALFGAGALIMRSAGCVVNDMWDAELDRSVERTRDRPLASGELTRRQAAAYVVGHGFAGLGILAQYDLSTIALGASSLGLVVAYPYMKRITYWPQLFLGLTFNWGVWLGYAAQSGSALGMPFEVLAPLYGSGVAWTLLYDTIYARSDMKDDVKVGIKSSALATAHAPRAYLGAFAAASTGLLAVSGVMAGLGAPFFALSVVGGGAHLAWQVASLQLDSATDAVAKFRANSQYGALVASGFVADALVSAL
ncbi:4-hydroxybenzoate polyprenyl transferase [Thecamonas trahens ATCC 50062]|uniref:4-hydroxybenzoate polyprenyltransferase, mitochondrial n=1 Tax=Thecamonas trahens ATCC 50062 TaxID=461836 RepID=A0A0L0DCJ5_THETB|nr:4-hydroxybenzoate polyprenyl transferase [Thecamonas trahens ATCC 50062]KNC49821.1 4-hydroxybenzoate polyprenyl transferase [Thecamonas trahens ATCC 50062]|eukprot:XP_013757316.1 4-hydroxybenzoate polyprenyl transferase [Thecamonas trahens ATCC 50062]